MFKLSKYNYKTSLMAVLVASSILYCGDPIPVEEMGNAKFEITKAANVKADIYAKEKYDMARATLFEAHDLVTKEKLKEAKEKAIAAQALALEAYNLAVPELAKKTKEEAAQMIKEADRAFAEELAADAFGNANSLMTAGDEKMTTEKYYEAFQSFENSREEAIKARNQAESKTENLQRELMAVEDLIKEAVSYGANDSTPDKITEANNSVKRAQEYLSNKYLKDAHAEIVKAKENATIAADIAKKDYATRKKIEAGAAVADAEKEMVNLKAELEKGDLKQKLAKSDESQESLKNTEETLSAAQASLNNAGLTLEAQKYTDSVEHSKEAMRLAQLVKDQVPALLVLIKQDKQPKQGPVVSSTTEPTKDTVTPSEMAEGWKNYTVRLIPERRDCLWRIAEYKDIYGDPFKWTRIYKANKGQIKNPDLIYPGQVFDIPPASGDITKPVVKPKQKEEVKKGQAETSIERPKMETDNTSTATEENSQKEAEVK